MKKIITPISLLIITFGITTFAGATLINRGGGLIYDTDLDITWLQDANFAKTSGYNADGLMTLGEAMNWAENMDYGGYNDWRLPTALNRDGSGPCEGLNCTGSEMGHLFYIELSHIADGGYMGNLGIFINEPLGNPSLSYGFWSSTENTLISSYPSAWIFEFNRGYQDFWSYQYKAYVLVVRDGDVASVPEPATSILLSLGMVGLIALKQKYWE